MVQIIPRKIPVFRQIKPFRALFYLCIILLVVFFVGHEKGEYYSIREHLGKADPLWIWAGIFVTLLYILFQGLAYYFSFSSIGKKLDLVSCSLLFLKRNFLSVFLPAGGFSSLVFFSGDAEKHGITKTQSYLASTVYAIIGLVSVLVIAFPVIIYLLIYKTLTSNIMVSFILLLILITALVLVLVSISSGHWIQDKIGKYFPKVFAIIDELKNEKIQFSQLMMTLFVSVLVDLAGIVHVLIAMLALGLGPHLEVALIVYTVMVVMLIVSPFLRGFGPIEITMSYTFISYGFSAGVSISVTLLFRFFEFWLPMFMGVISFITHRKNIILRMLPPFFMFILGIVNIISVLTPMMPDRMAILRDFLPLDAMNASHLLVFTAGLLMLLDSLFLLRGTYNAWLLALFLSVVSFLGHLTKALDYEEAFLAFLTIILLWYTRRQYVIKGDPRLYKLGYKLFFLALAASLVYGVIGFYYLDKRHFDKDFTTHESIKHVLRLFFMFDVDGLVPRTNFGRNFLYSLYGVGFGSVAILVFSLIRPFVYQYNTLNEEFDEARELLKIKGKSALDYFKIYNDKKLFFSKNRKAFISYRIAGYYAVVLEDPVCENEMEMLEILKEFESYCVQNGLKTVFYRVPETSVEIYKKLRKKVLLIGQEAILDLSTFTMSGSARKPERNAVNKIQEAGYRFFAYEAPIKEGLLQKIKFVSDQWLQEPGHVESLFSQGDFSWEKLRENTILTVENQEEKVVAFLNLIPDYQPGEATYDLQRKLPDAPNGVLDFLMVKCFEYLKEKGYQQINLGLAPLSGLDEAGKIPEKAMKYAYENIQTFAHYRGLRKFKEKWGPDWENKYLVYGDDYDLFSIPSVLSKVVKP